MTKTNPGVTIVCDPYIVSAVKDVVRAVAKNVQAELQYDHTEGGVGVELIGASGSGKTYVGDAITAALKHTASIQRRLNGQHWRHQGMSNGYKFFINEIQV